MDLDELLAIESDMQNELNAINFSKERIGESSLSDTKEIFEPESDSDTDWRESVKIDSNQSRQSQLPFEPMENVNSYHAIPEGDFITAIDAKGESIYFPKIKIESSSRTQNLYFNRLYNTLNDFESRIEVPKESKKQKLSIEELWIDKHEPHKFTELLSNEQCNFRVLKWCQQWNEFVHRAPSRFNQVQPPEKRIMMICGSPGLGKTTLAHIVGRMCGFEVLEINASDSRSGESLKNEIGAILGSTSVKSEKPKLLVLDEIDGIAGGEQSIINYLVRLTETPLEKQNALRRPIICICNDPFVPALKPLRAVCIQTTMWNIPAAKLAERLRIIGNKENMVTDNQALLCLCEMVDGDMRSALNTMQFILKNHGRLTMDTLKSHAVGLKDMTKSPYILLEDIFQTPTSRMLSSISLPIDSITSKKRNYFTKIMNDIDRNGDYQKLLMGCFENYLQVKYHDNNFSKVLQISEWINFLDQIQNEVEYLYGSVAIIQFHLLFSGSVKQKIKYPRQDYESSLMQTTMQNLLNSFVSNLKPFLRQFVQNTRTVFISLLLDIIEPTVSVSNPQLLKPYERSLLSRQVSVLVDCGLEYHQHKEGDTYSYLLSPNIQSLLLFPKKKPVYTVLQYLAGQIRKENLKQFSQPHTDEYKVPETKLFDDLVEFKIFYKYNEGYSCAVRKTVKLKNFF